MAHSAIIRDEMVDLYACGSLKYYGIKRSSFHSNPVRETSYDNEKSTIAVYLSEPSKKQMC